MQWMHRFEAVLLFTFLVTSTLSLGLQVGRQELGRLLDARGFLVRAVVANFVVVPLVGLLLVRILPLAPAVAGALLVLACTPGGLSAVQFTSKLRVDPALAGATFVLLCLLAVLVSPWLIRLALPQSVELDLAYGPVLGFVSAAVLVPLGAGMLVHQRAEQEAVLCARVLALIGTAAFVGFVLTTRSFRAQALADLGLPAVGGLLAFLGLSMLIGWCFGGPETSTRRLLAISTSMRNAALCLVIAQSSPSGSAIMTPLIGFSLLMVPPNMLFTVFATVRSRRSAAKAPA